MNLNDKYLDKSPQTASRIIDGEAVIIIPQEDNVKVLNGVGSRIWELLNGTRDVKQISSEISNEFDISHDEAFKDITEFVNELYQKNMVVVLNSPGENEEAQKK